MGRFKEFISAPPVVENLVFRKKLRQDLTKPPLYDGSFSKSTNFALFKAVWQTNALLLFQPTNQLAGPAYLPGKAIVSVFNGEHWLLEPGRYLETCTAPIGSFDNSVTTGIFFSVAELNQVLQGGVMHLRPGDITWTGNRFVAKDVADPDKRHFRIEGELLESDGCPTEMLVSYSTGNTSADTNARWRIKYFYEKTLDAEFLPSRIRAFWIRDAAQEVEMDDFEILKVQLAEQPLGREAFDLKPVLAGHPTAVGIFTNNAMHRLLPDGRLEKLESSVGKILARSTARLDPKIALGGICGLNLLFLVLVLKSRKRDTNLKQNNERKKTL